MCLENIFFYDFFNFLFHFIPDLWDCFELSEFLNTLIAIIRKLITFFFLWGHLLINYYCFFLLLTFCIFVIKFDVSFNMFFFKVQWTTTFGLLEASVRDNTLLLIP